MNLLVDNRRNLLLQRTWQLNSNKLYLQPLTKSTSWDNLNPSFTVTLNKKMKSILLIFVFLFAIENDPDPTQAYFWPAVNKKPTCLWHGYFLTRPEEKKIGKFDILGGNFPNSNPNHKWLTRPNLTPATKNWPYLGQKNLTRTHH